MQLTDSALKVLSALLEARTGQRLSVGRQWRIEIALVPVLKRHGISDCDALVSQLSASTGSLLADETVDALLNNETYFFRDQAAFAKLPQLMETIARGRTKDRKIRVWSAGCSTGQEIYSLAMQFCENEALWNGWTIDLLGTDISRTAIDQAREGNYSQFEIQRGLSTRHMLRWFEQRDDRWIIDDRLRQMVNFRRHNVLDTPPLGPFDLVLCRNVLLYFPAENRSRALANAARILAPDGALMLGAGETVLGYTDAFEILPGVSSVYRLAPATSQTNHKAA
ncbi:protein-glutamate O-methyltransferase CheR [Parasphingopyxis sp. CP4]|uniref:CheR family methyltransferase n=1 Tax=Parasphingopyxis sp. CP4 TaxID=2724527 RepID=UPI0015A01CAD|nr:protein-glutamate O-methyltransferase CheR [Parasphingopyxis sp. CP4]QLC21614.1 protein-glutamate O-methyltransferase CheR [Parasphingopyxis sp. CP4]